MSTVLIIPTRGRPGNADRLFNALADTSSDLLHRVCFAVDHDDPALPEYEKKLPPGVVRRVEATPQRMGPVLNTVAMAYAEDPDFTHIGFMGDDHMPRTEIWDELLVDALGGDPGVAYGNDLVQGGQLPTACIIDARLIRALGFMAPPGLQHLFIDDFWRDLGLAVGNLAYEEDVVIEHLHPAAGTADWDDGYRKNNAQSQFIFDESRYTIFKEEGGWDAALNRLRKEGIEVIA